MDKEQQPDASSREDVHAAKAKQMEETQKLHPETDMKLGSNWWQPGTDLSSDVKVTVTIPSLFTSFIIPTETYTNA